MNTNGSSPKHAPETLDLVELQDAVREIAEEFPDFVYTPMKLEGIGDECLYFPSPGNPHGCIIGAALKRVHWWDLLVMVIGDPQMDWHAIEDLIDILIIEGYIKGEVDAQKDWLQAVQESQDKKVAWNQCVRNADTHKVSPLEMFEAEFAMALS